MASMICGIFSSDSIIMSDYIKKSPPLNRNLSNWRLRWFVLYDNKNQVKQSRGLLHRQILLKYYKNEEAFRTQQPPKGTINLQFAKIREGKKKVRGYGNLIEVLTKQRLYYLSFASVKTYKAWLEQLKHTCDDAWLDLKTRLENSYTKDKDTPGRRGSTDSGIRTDSDVSTKMKTKLPMNIVNNRKLSQRISTMSGFVDMSGKESDCEFLGENNHKIHNQWNLIVQTTDARAENSEDIIADSFVDMSGNVNSSLDMKYRDDKASIIRVKSVDILNFGMKEDSTSFSTFRTPQTTRRKPYCDNSDYSDDEFDEESDLQDEMKMKTLPPRFTSNKLLNLSEYEGNLGKRRKSTPDVKINNTQLMKPQMNILQQLRMQHRANTMTDLSKNSTFHGPALSNKTGSLKR